MFIWLNIKTRKSYPSANLSKHTKTFLSTGVATGYKGSGPEFQETFLNLRVVDGAVTHAMHQKYTIISTFKD